MTWPGLIQNIQHLYDYELWIMDYGLSSFVKTSEEALDYGLSSFVKTSEEALDYGLISSAHCRVPDAWCREVMSFEFQILQSAFYIS